MSQESAMRVWVVSALYAIADNVPAIFLGFLIGAALSRDGLAWDITRLGFAVTLLVLAIYRQKGTR